MKRPARGDHFADPAGVNNLPNASRAHMMRPHESIHEPNFFGAAVTHQIGRFLRRRRQRLFAEDVLAGIGCLLRPLDMQGIRQRQVDGINLGVGEQVFVPAKSLGDARACRGLLAFAASRLATATSSPFVAERNPGSQPR